MIESVRLQQFRSWRDDVFEFKPGVNIVVGPNASGKTNLLEALSVICLGKSYRARDSELISRGRRWARLDGREAGGGERTVKLAKHEELTKKSFVINGRPHQRLSPPKTVPAVLFEPDHLRLLTGSPEKRRDFLDELLARLVPAYASLRRQYNRALAQRNNLLKNRSSRDQLFVWNVRLSELGGQLASRRAALARQIDQQLQSNYRALAPGQAQVSAIYASSCGDEHYSTVMLKKLEAGVATDLARGFTAHGPHRDDLVILLDGQPVSEGGSRGEIRTLALGLKLAETDLIEKKHSAKPVLLLDDVFGELDGARRRALTKRISGYQALITTTDADIVVRHFLGNCHVIPTTGH